jgi:hypothetical protein
MGIPPAQVVYAIDVIPVRSPLLCQDLPSGASEFRRITICTTARCTGLSRDESGRRFPVRRDVR